MKKNGIYIDEVKVVIEEPSMSEGEISLWDIRALKPQQTHMIYFLETTTPITRTMLEELNAIDYSRDVSGNHIITIKEIIKEGIKIWAGKIVEKSVVKDKDKIKENVRKYIVENSAIKDIVNEETIIKIEYEPSFDL